MGLSIVVRNRQRALRIDVRDLQAFAERALERCLKSPPKKMGWCNGFDEIGVVLVSNRRIAELHRRFMGIRGPTDVITFQHGEIVVSAETARSQARTFGSSLGHELRLYIAHGLLHLQGFDDKDPKGATEMCRLQKRLVAVAAGKGG